MVELIVNTGGNQKYWPVVAAAGLRNGARLPSTVYGDLYFADQDWKHPRQKQYIAMLEKHRPHLATVLDWEVPAQFNHVMEWAHQAAQFVGVVIIIPKVDDIGRIPETVDGKPVRLGYSVPTSHGSTPVPISSFVGWSGGVHLLGGNPLKQLKIAKTDGLDIRSVDCNYIMLKANKWAEFLDFKAFQHDMFGGRGQLVTRWRQLKEVGLHRLQEAPTECMRRSSETLRYCWQFDYVRKP